MLLDVAALQKSAELHPEVIEYARANPQPPLDWEDWASVRATLSVISQMNLAQIGAPEADINEETKCIPMRDGYQSLIKIHRPRRVPEGGSPLIVFYFGGGFISGDMHQVTPVARAWVRLFGATVVSPSYRLAPQNKFPKSQNDAWDSVKWLDEHAHEIGADPKVGFIVSGVSAGAACASAVATNAIEDKLKNPLTGQYLGAPLIMDKDCVPERYKSYFIAREQNKDAAILTADALCAIAKHTEADPQSPWRYPVHAKAPLSQQPRAYFMVHGQDPLRDDGMIWEEMLKEAGVKTKIDFYPGCPHAHNLMMPTLPISMKATGDQMVGVGWLLGKDVTPEQGLAALAMPPAA